MLQVARLAPNVLGEASDAIVEYLQSQFHADGGAIDRAGESDLYYTVFALDGLCALQAELPTEALVPFLERFGTGDALDLVHLSCLAHCWAMVPREQRNRETLDEIGRKIGEHRRSDGGFAESPEAEDSALYSTFLAIGACEDLQISVTDLNRLADRVADFQLSDGSFAGLGVAPFGTTPTTAAGAVLLNHLQRTAGPSCADWLLARFREETGGFSAIPEAPMPDLLSTAVSLHALACFQTPLGGIAEGCLDFVDSLWTGRGFCGTWADEAPDAEYTWYGLLSLGHLSLYT